MSRLAWIAFALATIGAAAVSGALVHSYDRAQHERVVADLRRDAATELAKQTAAALKKADLETQRAALLEEEYQNLADETARLQSEGHRLSADLRDARRRLHLLAGTGGRGGDAALPASGPGAGGCQVVQAALDRTLAALERLESGGDAAAELGQKAVDVATACASDARTKGIGHE